jgi:hypothetical protein
MGMLTLLSQRARLGDDTAVVAIGKVLAENPHVQENGDLGRQLRSQWLQLAAGADPVKAESIRRHLEEVERGWTNSSAGPAGRLLAARAATCLLALQVADEETAAAANRKDVAGLRDAMARQTKAGQLFKASLQSLAAHQALTRNPPSPAHPPRPVEEPAGP